jgi:hypothetical protein
MPVTKPFGRKYRLITVDPVSRRTDCVRHLETADDEAAILRAEQLRAGRAAELWSGYRVVRRWEKG